MSLISYMNNKSLSGSVPEGSLWQGPSICSTKVSKEVVEDESKIHVSTVKMQIFFVGSAMAAKYTPVGEGLARKGWNIKPNVSAGICTEFNEALFEAVVDSCERVVLRHSA